MKVKNTFVRHFTESCPDDSSPANRFVRVTLLERGDSAGVVRISVDYTGIGIAADMHMPVRSTTVPKPASTGW